ncbi:MAG: ParB/RepB/Spo0J family partition protein [Actinobacteria bacterium]|nr:ParB/RepB/Spo0J family partition protein [Actinomycetota bacterium]MTA17870.1 ParB/RepB/Spo0J family partition protein [Actinomycetota bacterium]
MVARRSGLGKGLGSLIPTTERLQDSDAILRELPISEIVANTYQPRSHFDEEALVSLSASIRSVGVLQPILVRELGEDSYELIAGERRWRAAKRAGLQTIPAIVRTAEDEGSLEQALVENLHREDLGALEEAAAYQQLIEEFKLTQDQVATRVGKSRSAVANTMRLLQLPTSIQRLLGEGQLSAGHARALLGTPDRAFQEKLAKAIVSEKLTVREVEDRVREHGGTPEPEAGGTTPTGTKPPTLVRPAPLLELEEMLSDHLDTRVAVSMGQRKGRIVIDFSTLEDLERVYRVIVDGKEPMD